MDAQLWLGTAKVDITPRQPVALAGFASRIGQGPYTEVLHPIHARIFAFRQGGEDGKLSSSLLVTADLIWWGSDRVGELRQAIALQWGIPKEAILLHGTHSHSGPQTSGLFSDLLGKMDPDYMADLEAVVLAGIEEAMGDLETVHTEVGQGSSYLAVHRRRMVDGVCMGQANPDGALDSDLNVVRYRSMAGKTKAVLTNYACHPVISPANTLSSEFCGVAMELLEREIGGGAICGYLQGCCGDNNPAKAGELFFDGTDADVRAFGESLATDVLELLRGPLQPLPTVALTVRTQILQAPLQDLPNEEELQALTADTWVSGEWSQMLLASPERLTPFLPMEITVLQLAEGLQVMATNTELVAEYGLYIKSRTTGMTLILGYTNGMIGYIPTADQLAEGGYEAIDSTRYFFMPAPFHPAIKEKVKHSCLELLAP